MQARNNLCKMAALAFVLVLTTTTAKAHVASSDDTPTHFKNGSIGVALVEMFERVGACGSRTLIVVVTNAVFEKLADIGRLDEDTPFLVDLIGTKYRLSLQRDDDVGYWISGRVTSTSQRVIIVSEEHAKVWR